MNKPQNTKSFKLGDQVRVTTNAQGTIWEQGKIMGICETKALIGYGTSILPDSLRLLGQGKMVPFNELEIIS